MEALKKKAVEHMKKGEFNDAAIVYNTVLAGDPENALMYSNRSLAHYKLGSYDAALADASKCTELKPQWAKGYLRKAVALHALQKHKEAMGVAAEGFKHSSDQTLSKELVQLWLRSCERVHAYKVDLPQGIVILSEDYATVVVYLMRSLNNEQPLSHVLTEQCLCKCASILKSLLEQFGEATSNAITEWASLVPHNIYPYNPASGVVNKGEILKALKSKSDEFVEFLNGGVDPALYPVVRPVLGLIVLVITNRTNILSESNTGHHAAELMNCALLPLFESSLLATPEYYSMYVGRLCSILDSFIGRGYRLDPDEIKVVRVHCKKLKKVMEQYPKQLDQYAKDCNLASSVLKNVAQNVLEPSGLAPPSPPPGSIMTVEVAEHKVKELPIEVKDFLIKHLAAIETAKFMSLRDVEDLLTMTGIFLELGDSNPAKAVFSKGEQAFFTVFAHFLSTHAITLDECPAAIAPIRQLVFTEASVLGEPAIFADVVVRWKSLFTGFRTLLIQRGLSSSFSDLFTLHVKDSLSSSASQKDFTAALQQHMDAEEEMLRAHGPPMMQLLSQQNYLAVQEALEDNEFVLDYVFFATIKDNPLLEGRCVFFGRDVLPVVVTIDYAAVRKLSSSLKNLFSCCAVKNELSEDAAVMARIRIELFQLAEILFPAAVLDLLAVDKAIHIYISPDAELMFLPLDILPFGELNLPPGSQISVSILSSSRDITRSKLATKAPLETRPECYIVSSPNYSLQKSSETPLGFLAGMLEAITSYFPSPSQEEFKDLKFAEEEAGYVSASLTGLGLTTKMLTGNNATVGNFLSIKNPYVLHVTTHASASSERSAFRGNFWSDLRSSIILAGYSTYRKGRFDYVIPDCGTGLLPALAICSMRLQNTRLVYLSTCVSAVGSSPAQEAVGSLAEAFLAAGAETVIATLLPVEDQIAAEVCKSFYDKIGNPSTRPSQALALVKQEMSSLHPECWIYWSSFACFGLDKPLIW